MTCNYCKIIRHFEAVCRKKFFLQKSVTYKGTGRVQRIETCSLSDASDDFLQQSSSLKGSN